MLQLEEQLRAIPSWNERVNFLVNTSPEHVKYTKRYQNLIMHAAYNRIKAILKYEGIAPNCLSTPTTLIRPSEISLTTEEDYGLSKVKKFCRYYSLEYLH